MLLVLGPHWDPLVYISKDGDKESGCHIYLGVKPIELGS